MKKKSLITKSLITILKPESMVAESYKMFRTNLSFTNVDKENQVIMFTSSSSEEGKTTTVCNTAVEFARNGSKTLLIECDLRKARLHELFAINQSPGVTNVTIKKMALDEAIQPIKEVPGLDILTAGPLPPSPSELIASESLKKLLAEARGKYDKILIDAPPVLTVTDGAVLSRCVDGVVLIVAADETKKDTCLQAKKVLNKVNANILGVVLTKMDMKKQKYYYGYKSYYGNDRKNKGLRGLFSRKKTKTEFLKDEDLLESK